MKIPQLPGVIVANQVQLRIAARIHFILKRDLGEGINVPAMLSDPDEAREVLFVCQASGNRELVSLARQFVHAGKLAAPEVAVKGDAPQDAAWARHSSGFGVSQPSAQPPVPEESSWRSATQWLRRGPRAVTR
ncbi:hypothetical protein LRS03_21680 [Rhizobacter sp. J219]|uniref:hypothetical protein n=1 Tax=Rhizobacter sp. J219 TaxID=2898430 RepID=UPI0021506F31|nr:hypothetical protein [Rhizobacter sp. J219]MCR5885324.1 hypothetical protein [Rhizobacter sp. J219]